MRSMRSKYSAYRVAKYIGSYVAAMNGVDAIAFTAGIGENTALVRRSKGNVSILVILVSARTMQRTSASTRRRGSDLYFRFQRESMRDPDQRGTCDRKRNRCSGKINRNSESLRFKDVDKIRARYVID